MQDSINKYLSKTFELGRVPTPEAYRYYVEKISGTARLAPQDQGTIDGMLQGITDVQRRVQLVEGSMADFDLGERFHAV